MLRLYGVMLIAAKGVQSRRSRALLPQSRITAEVLYLYVHALGGGDEHASSYLILRSILSMAGKIRRLLDGEGLPVLGLISLLLVTNDLVIILALHHCF